MGLVEAIILGLVQGITEFLPISSSGHLVIAREWLAVSDINALAFDAMLHFATTVAVILYFWQDILTLLRSLFRKLGRLPVNEKDMIMIYALAIGTIPAVVLGLVMESFIASTMQSAYVVAIVLFVVSFFFMYAEWRYYMSPARTEITLKRGILVGCFQALAILPGFSRSGATIAGGMLLGLSRYDASRFSFLLAIPITLGVGFKKFIDLLQQDGSVDWTMIVVGSLVAMVSALLVIHFFLSFIRKHTLWPFIWYGILLSGFITYISFFT